MSRVVTVREHDSLAGSGLDDEDLAELRRFARDVLKRVDGDMAASSYVGMVTTRRGSVLEILPKIDLDEPHGNPLERTRHVFLDMLRVWRRLPAQVSRSDIRSMARFPMLEVFVRQFLHMLAPIARNGLARRYVNVEENRRYLRGRLVFGGCGSETEHSGSTQDCVCRDAICRSGACRTSRWHLHHKVSYERFQFRLSY